MAFTIPLISCFLFPQILFLLYSLFTTEKKLTLQEIEKKQRMKKNKMTITKVTLTVLFALFIQSTTAQATDSNWMFIFGYKTLRIKNYSYSHDTHVDDWFLPNASLPGSAGTTEFNGLLHCGVFGIRYSPEISEPFSYNFDFEFLYTNRMLDWRLSDNEIRPDDGYYRKTYIYSATPYGLGIALNLAYYIGRFSFGIENQLNGVTIINGLDRNNRGGERIDNFSSGVNKVGKLYLLPSTGLKVSFMLDTFRENAFLEGIIQYGNSFGYGVQLVISLK